MDAAVLAARVLLAGVFAVAGTTKLRDPTTTEQALPEFGLSPALASPAARILPAVELLIAFALLVHPLVTAGGVGAAVLLATFIAAIGNALRHGRAPDCGCFGNLTQTRVSGRTVARNVALLAVAVFVASRGADTHVSTGLALAAAVIVIAAAVGAAWAGLAAGPGGMVLVDASPSRGLAPGTAAPAFRLPTTSGEPRSLADFRERELPIVMIFLDSGCGSCSELHPHLRRWQRALEDRIAIVVVMRGETATAEMLAARHGVEDVLVDTGAEPLSAGFAIASTPSAVVIDAAGAVATRPARGADAIEELVRQTLTRAGDAETWKQPSRIA